MKYAFDIDDIVGAVRDFYKDNDGDEATTDIILNLGSEILGCSVDELLSYMGITMSDCDKCRYGYELYQEGVHTYCGANCCYMCVQTNGNHCNEYIVGDIPADKERF